MPTIVHEFAWPDRVVIGTVGRPGSRAFFLQVRTRARTVSVALEKEQSALLAEKIEEILDALMANEGNPFSIPTTTPIELVDNDPLEQPLAPQFRTGAMSLGWDPSTAQIVIEAYALPEMDDPEMDDPEMDDPGSDDMAADDTAADDADPDSVTVEPQELLRVRMPVGTARAFAKRTLEVVLSGRPLCPFCGTPVDPEGHACPLPGDPR